MSFPYALRRALARLGLMPKPPFPTLPGGPHLQTLASAVQLAASREAQAKSDPGYVSTLDAASKLLGQLAKAAAAGDARRR